MSFATYWDLEPKTRAALSESDVQRYLDAELMLKGVLKVDPPIYDDAPELPEIAKTTWYKVAGFELVFATGEQALAFAALNPRTHSSKYIGNYWQSREKIEHLNAESTPGEVTPILLATEAEVGRHKAAIEKRGAVCDANRKKSDDYEKAVKLQNDALSGLWQDWHERRAEAAQHRKVVDTYAAYVQTAGDHDVAAKFLMKVFSVEQIKDASEWMGVTIKTTFEDGPEPGPSHPDAPAPAPAASPDIPF